MKRVLCPQLPKPQRPVVLSEDEANHAVRVLRLRDGDSVEAIDGQGHSAPAILRVLGGPPRLELAMHEKAAAARTDAPDAVTPLILEVAILKGDAMEWVVEKAVELGVRSLAPVLTAHTVVQIKNKGPEAFRDRWQKIADQSLKQCGRLERLEVQIPLPLEEAIARNPASAQAPRFWCDEAAGTQAVDLPRDLQSLTSLSRATLLIGPEGGWSAEERQWLSSTPGIRKVQLGPLILRAETAALYGASLLTGAIRSANRLTKTHG
jgi:16S rRNA (uracil1498-N3)-methyltransferase